MNPFLAAAIQMTSGTEVTENLRQAATLIKAAKAEGAQLVVLPENFALMSAEDSKKLNIAEMQFIGPIQAFLAEQAAQHQIWLIGGTIPLKSPEQHKVYNACTAYNDQGEQVACYKKIHLFDARVNSSIEIYEESKTICPGKDIIVMDTPFGRLGLAICYDLRFPELFRILGQQGAEIIAIPTAFTVKTGQAHWEVLMRARAIENFCYLIGACQTGVHANGRQTYGHSLIIHPWGNILACLPTETGIITAEVCSNDVHQIRADFPVYQHRKL